MRQTHLSTRVKGLVALQLGEESEERHPKKAQCAPSDGCQEKGRLSSLYMYMVQKPRSECKSPNNFTTAWTHKLNSKLQSCRERVKHSTTFASEGHPKTTKGVVALLLLSKKRGHGIVKNDLQWWKTVINPSYNEIFTVIMTYLFALHKRRIQYEPLALRI